MGEPHQVDIRLDGALLKRFTVGGEGKGMTTPENFAGNTPGDPEWEHYMQNADRGLEIRVPVKAGPHTLASRLSDGCGSPKASCSRRRRDSVARQTSCTTAYPALKTVSIGGPFNVKGPGESPSPPHALRVHAERPRKNRCARKILSTSPRAPIGVRSPTPETQVLLDFYKAGRSEEKTFDAGIQRGLERMLAAPSFVFRVEHRRSSGTVRHDLDLASRLSFFMWSSIPDEELLNAAIRGKLRDPSVLEQQVRRMLRDPRSSALVEGFATRWLELSKLAGFVPDTQLYPEFDENLREACGTKRGCSWPIS